MNHRSIWSTFAGATALAVLVSACSGAPIALPPAPLSVPVIPSPSAAAATATPATPTPTQAPATPTPAPATPSPGAATPTPTPVPTSTATPTSSAILTSVNGTDTTSIFLAPQKDYGCGTSGRSADVVVRESGYTGAFTAVTQDATFATVAPTANTPNTFTVTSASMMNGNGTFTNVLFTDSSGKSASLRIGLTTCLP